MLGSSRLAGSGGRIRGREDDNHMRMLKIRSSRGSLLILKRSHRWSNKMVYILVANKLLRYSNGRSRILYIGTTKVGANRPAASAVNKASEIFYKLHGVRTIEVHIITCGRRKNVPTWRRLESSLLDAFRKTYFELPHYNKVRPRPTEGLFSTNALRKIIEGFERLDVHMK
jgi:hypothetical protein